MNKSKVNVLVFFLMLGFRLNVYSQNAGINSLNLDFESGKIELNDVWGSFGSEGYNIYLDSLNTFYGNYSLVIESKSDLAEYKALSIRLPENYAGQSISLKGFLKTENVKDGFAGLWMRIDPNLKFDNMANRGLVGTNDWKEYEITLDLVPNKTDQIVIGALLVGKGKIWIDNLSVFVDGKSLGDTMIPVYEKPIFPAQLDKEFDNGSSLDLSELSKEAIDNLEILGKIWGFLKYHHPVIASGSFNWDYELFRFLPAYLKAGEKGNRDSLLISWIENLGVIKPIDISGVLNEEVFISSDLTWLESSELSESLKSTLKFIYDNRNQGDNFYIELHPGVQNPNFINENPYHSMSYPDSGFRILALYRYWNMIAYFFPYRNQTDKDWSLILKEYLPIFLDAKNKLEYEIACLKLIAEVNDTHANLWGGKEKINQIRGSNFAPFKGVFVEDQFVVTDYYNPEYQEVSKLTIGDIITHIDNKEIQTLVDSLKPYYPASNQASFHRDVAVDLLRSSKEKIKLKFIQDGKIKENEIPLFERKELNYYHWYKVDPDEKSYRLLQEEIGYINLANIKQEDIPAIKQEFKNTEGIIIDIRNYPSSFVPFTLGSFFMNEPTEFVVFSKGDIQNPGQFELKNKIEIPASENSFKGKLVVLVNEYSQSQAEYTAMAFRAVKNSIIIGSQTAGADGNVSDIVLPGGIETMISGIGVFYPDGKPTQRIGIIPDIIVKPTIGGIKNKKDEMLDQAIEIILRKNLPVGN